MPTGRYRVIGDEGQDIGWEAFRSAPGPAGWRYVSEVETNEFGPHRATVDLTVDAAWRLIRVRITTAEHALELRPRGNTLAGGRDGEPLEVPWGPDDHLDYLTPATNLITCRRLAGSAEIDVLYVDPFTLVPTRERQRYQLAGTEVVRTPVGRFGAERWTYTSLGSGWTSDLWVAGDTVVLFDRIFELEEYEPGATGPRALP